MLYVIDGLNICMLQVGEQQNNPSRRKSGSLAPLLTLLIALKKNGHISVSVFDSSINGLVNRPQNTEGLFKDILSKYPMHFSEITGKTDADTFMLAYADKYQLNLISNDQYKPYRDKYKWIDDTNGRLVKVAIVAGNLNVPDLGILQPISSKTQELVGNFVESMKTVCLRCGFKIHISASFCSNCGIAQDNCHLCGVAKQSAQARYCRMCGTQFS